jgi:hypothetical protein
MPPDVPPLCHDATPGAAVNTVKSFSQFSKYVRLPKVLFHMATMPSPVGKSEFAEVTTLAALAPEP